MAIEVGSLVVEMSANVARLSQDMDKVRGTVDSTMAGVQRAASVATTALGMIGVGVSVAGMTNIVKNAIDAMAALDDLAATAGTTVENMSALAAVAKVGGHEIGAVEDIVIKLNKALRSSGEEGKKAEAALAAIGLSAVDLRAMDTADAVLEVAKALAQYTTDGNKAQLMNELIGKSGAKAIPFMQDLAEKGELVARVMTADAAAAEEFQKNLNRIGLAADDAAIKIAGPLTRAVNDAIDNFKRGREAGLGFWQALTGVGVRGIGESIDDARANSKQHIAELRAELDKLNKDRAYYAERGDTQMARDVQVDIDKAQSKMRYFQNLYAELIAEQNKASYSNEGRRRSGASIVLPSSIAENNKPVGKGSRERIDDFDSRINQAVASAIDNSAIVKAREYAVVLERLDKLYFESGLDTEVYASAVQKVSGMTDKAAASHDRLAALMAATPTERIEETRKDMILLAEAFEAGRISEEEYTEAVRTRLGTMKDDMGEADDVARQLGLTFSSAAEDAILKWESLGDVVRAVISDIARMAVRKSFTEPMAEAITGQLTSWGASSWFKSVLPSFASGGDHMGGVRLVGENGPEIEATGPARIFNAQQTRSILSGGGGADGSMSVRVEIDNNGTPARVSGVQPRIDPGEMVIKVFLDDMRTNGPMRQSIAGLRGA